MWSTKSSITSLTADTVSQPFLAADSFYYRRHIRRSKVRRQSMATACNLVTLAVLWWWNGGGSACCGSSVNDTEEDSSNCLLLFSFLSLLCPCSSCSCSTTSFCLIPLLLPAIHISHISTSRQKLFLFKKIFKVLTLNIYY